MKRRRSLRVAVLLALLFAVTAGIVYAGFEYCADPMLDVAGRTLNILVGVPPEVLDRLDAEHPIRVTVKVPRHLLDRTEIVDPGDVYRMALKGRGRQKITVRVKAPKFEDLGKYEVQVSVDMDALGFHEIKSGWSNRPIKIKIKDPAIKTW